MSAYNSGSGTDRTTEGYNFFTMQCSGAASVIWIALCLLLIIIAGLEYADFRQFHKTKAGSVEEKTAFRQIQKIYTGKSGSGSTDENPNFFSMQCSAGDCILWMIICLLLVIVAELEIVYCGLCNKITPQLKEVEDDDFKEEEETSRLVNCASPTCLVEVPLTDIEPVYSPPVIYKKSKVDRQN
ncbi:Hypothetical predicted protein [Cloeon dipterum]|uniref:Uncharacterized protein n=1 Tax=Cloeon dipterum TaxID=197152 RepID=A0A8S1DY81_9INSE|nr:Hypothetical predicted protein [Cloeon dipterum]